MSFISKCFHFCFFLFCQDFLRVRISKVKDSIVMTIDISINHFTSSNTRMYKNHYWLNDTWYEKDDSIFMQQWNLATSQWQKSAVQRFKIDSQVSWYHYCMKTLILWMKSIISDRFRNKSCFDEVWCLQISKQWSNFERYHILCNQFLFAKSWWCITHRK